MGTRHAQPKADERLEFYAWACFKAHQAAEYALKALLRGARLQSFPGTTPSAPGAGPERCAPNSKTSRVHNTVEQDVHPHEVPGRLGSPSPSRGLGLGEPASSSTGVSRGDFNLWSDVDVLVASPAFSNMRPLDRYDLLPAVGRVEPIPVTPAELEKMLAKPSWRQALRDAVVIHDPLGVEVALRRAGLKPRRLRGA